MAQVEYKTYKMGKMGKRIDNQKSEKISEGEI
jgi:hypothetical protein